MRCSESKQFPGWYGRSLTGLSLLFLFMGCGEEEGPPRKETTKLTGQVLVDGKPPDSPLKVTCHNLAGMDKNQPTISTTLTDQEGKFSMSTYESGDGVPPGDYVLTFFWGKMDLIGGGYGGKDKLKGKYSDPEKSPIEVSIQPGEPVDLGKIKLTTK